MVVWEEVKGGRGGDAAAAAADLVYGARGRRIKQRRHDSS